METGNSVFTRSYERNAKLDAWIRREIQVPASGPADLEEEMDGPESKGERGRYARLGKIVMFMEELPGTAWEVIVSDEDVFVVTASRRAVPEWTNRFAVSRSSIDCQSGAAARGAHSGTTTRTIPGASATSVPTGGTDWLGNRSVRFEGELSAQPHGNQSGETDTGATAHGRSDPERWDHQCRQGR